MTTSPSSSAKQAQEALGVRLRELRRDAGLTGRALAAALGWHFTRVSKLEHGVQAPTDADIRDWCHACRADDHVPDLLATLRTVESAYLEFRRQARAGMKRVLGAHTVALYDRTTLFRIYEHNVIPGLFQTADYSAAMLAFWIQFGTAETQAGQLDRLLAVMSLPTISLGIIPMMTERPAVASAGFWIFDNVLAALETPTASIEVTRPQEIELYARMFDRLLAAAVHGKDARALITKTLEELG